LSRLDAISPAKVKLELTARRELALIDLREEAAFATGHPLFAAQLSLSRLEIEIFGRIPRLDTLLVLYDNGEGLVARAAPVLRELGYHNLRVLEGGLAGWRAAGFELFEDVNSYSKAFGELVEQRRRTPSLPAGEVKALLESGADVVVMDARRFDEYEVMSIPTAVNVPGAELVLRARALAPDPRTQIIVNCAGRTRSLIGAQSLLNAGLPNPVAALRNGTIGWTLAGQALDHGRADTYGEVSPAALAEAQAAARNVAYRAGVRRVTPLEVASLAREAGRTLYRFDVRAPAEYERGHLPGFRCAPGGQLVQEIDAFAPVRGARVVLFDDSGVRADMTASWLAQMGWDVYVLDPQGRERFERGLWRQPYPPLPSPPEIAVDTLGVLVARGEASVVDLATSRDHTKGHIPGAWFAVRAQLSEALSRITASGLLVFTSPDGALARIAASEVALSDGRQAFALTGGTAAWVRSGQPLESGLTRAATDPVDIYRRPYEGEGHSAQAMQAYLDWEFGLVAQLERDASHGFHVI
jgi:rhodanese-related sulfurtransferase